MVIGGKITVTVMEVSGQTVRLGIEAPSELSIYREEIWLAVQAENLAAAGSDAEGLERVLERRKQPPREGDSPG